MKKIIIISLLFFVFSCNRALNYDDAKIVARRHLDSIFVDFDKEKAVDCVVDAKQKMCGIGINILQKDTNYTTICSYVKQGYTLKPVEQSGALIKYAIYYKMDNKIFRYITMTNELRWYDTSGTWKVLSF